MYTTTIGRMRLGVVYNAAGVWDTTWRQCNDLHESKYCGATVTKSCTLEPRNGNSYPKYHFTPSVFSINSNGLENYGLEYYLTNVLPSMDHPVFYSIGGMSDTERINMVTIANQHLGKTKNTGIELNLSCPNLDCVGPAYSASALDNSLRTLFEATGKISTTFGLKLPPFYLPCEFIEIGDVLHQYDAQIDFITCINSIPNGIDYNIDNNTTSIIPNTGYGGIGGPAVLPVGLANVRRFTELFSKNYTDIQLIGCGGISTGADVYKYLLAGADAVQVGTHLWKNGPKVFEQLYNEFDTIMRRKGYYQITDIPHC